MGSLPRGTLCAYCGVNEAGYIPDGYVGPVCIGDSEEEPAKIFCINLPIEEAKDLRARRLWTARSAPLCREGAMWIETVVGLNIGLGLGKIFWRM